MAGRDLRWHVSQALENARLAVREAERRGATWSDDPLLTAGMTKLVENVGEHLGSVPTAAQARYPDLPWDEIRGTRDILVHEYHRLDVEILRGVVDHDLRALIPQLERMLKDKP